MRIRNIFDNFAVLVWLVIFYGLLIFGLAFWTGALYCQEQGIDILEVFEWSFSEYYGPVLDATLLN